MKNTLRTSSSPFDRQAFLGPDAQERFERCTVGIVGLGGGGSHIVQQLAHIGFTRLVVYDPDVFEDTNMHRLVGAREADSATSPEKIAIARRVVRAISKRANVAAYRQRWQENPLPLRECDIVFGCSDTFSERHELEACCRRYLIPYIDIGMDVNQVGDQPPVMAGQVILSLPGDLCMWCMGFLTHERLTKEAALYGATGGRPQVIWPNGVLASTTVGIAVDLITDWSRSLRRFVYLSYNGATGVIEPHARTPYLPDAPCPHFPLDQVGEPRMQVL